MLRFFYITIFKSFFKSKFLQYLLSVIIHPFLEVRIVWINIDNYLDMVYLTARYIQPIYHVCNNEGEIRIVYTKDVL